MIETVYSNESGESGKNKVSPTFKMPKNIRQIGKGNASKNIYVEDYVMTFIKQLAGGDYSGYKLAVLVGQCVRSDNARNIFVSGALEIKDIGMDEDIVFSNEVWTSIYEDIKEYFVDAEIVGWFIGGPGYLLADEEKILKLHLDNFAGQDKVLLTFDNMEREEAFYCYENSKLTKQVGYYIYYEKNEEMQNYMIGYKNVPSSEAAFEDKVSKDIRTVLQNKKSTAEESQNPTRLMYAAGTLLAAIILVVGAAILNNYDQMKSMQKTMEYLTVSMEQMQGAFTDENAASVAANSSNVKNEEPKAEDSKAEKEAVQGDASKEQSLEVEVLPGGVKNTEATEKTANKATDKEATIEKETVKAEPTAAPTPIPTPKPKKQVKKTEKAAASTPSKETQKTVNYYVVQEGDTLAGISYKLYKTYTKAKTIMKLNDIENPDYIFAGQKLIVP